MLVLGLSGGIATGKSTVSKRIREKYGIPVIDADVIAREVVQPGRPAYNAIVDYFGGMTPHLVRDDGSGELNRAALGRVIFANEQHRKVLNSIVHPAVRKAMLWSVVRAWLAGNGVVVLDVPLLFESSLHVYCGTTVAVLCDEDTQYRRLRARDRELSAAEARDRIAAQFPLERKRELADIVIENDGSLDELYAALDRVMAAPPVHRPAWLTLLQWIPPVGLLWGFFVYWRGTRARASKL